MPPEKRLDLPVKMPLLLEHRRVVPVVRLDRQQVDPVHLADPKGGDRPVVLVTERHNVDGLLQLLHKELLESLYLLITMVGRETVLYVNRR